MHFWGLRFLPRRVLLQVAARCSFNWKYANCAFLLPKNQPWQRQLTLTVPRQQRYPENFVATPLIYIPPVAFFLQLLPRMSRRYRNLACPFGCLYVFITCKSGVDGLLDSVYDFYCFLSRDNWIVTNTFIWLCFLLLNGTRKIVPTIHRHRRRLTKSIIKARTMRAGRRPTHCHGIVWVYWQNYALVCKRS